MIRPIATTNSGRAVTASVVTVKTWSSQPSRRSAASAPSPTPATAPISPVIPISTAELMSLGATYPQTGRPLTSE